ncbi:D-alanyl-D-alanine carboxypeptidase family protein [Streptomyces sp. I05A-00742]|uniref:D-alanyl-D-alanine carboxypeptidase family protein n=1 Tax=Streptomyces sp. I05A-00742 TaxID=2732853 RepID=UPI0014899EF2|nr:D-alanyl-D-alanine carboxypeptidase [Streptomyces sp. I05A-00742]
MAGESPDKSEQGKPSGEAAGGEHDPRLGVLRESGSAVAVAGETGGSDETDETGNKSGASGRSGESVENSQDGEGGKGGDGKDGKAAKASEGAVTASSGSTPARSSDASDVSHASDDAREERDGSRPAADGEGATGGRATGSGAKADAEAGTETDADAKPAKSGAAEGARPEGRVPAGDARLKAAVAAWVASTEDDDEPEGSGGSAAAGADGAKSSGSSPDQPTQLIKAPAAAPAPGEKKNADDKPVDRPTAAFGIVRPDRADGAEGKAPSASPKQASKQPARNGDAKADAKGAAPKAEPSGSSSADQPTALIKAPAVPPAAPGAGERASRFVPLKSDDAAPGKAASAPGKPAAPAGPAVPVKVTPPAPAARPAAGPGGPERTMQTPMPAGPDGEKQAPLDLLAQLTNTPPPPETPVRNVVRRVKIWTPIVVLLLIIGCVVQAFRPLPDASLVRGKQAAYTFGGEKFDMKWPTEGQSAAKVVGVGDLGTYGPQKPVPTASMAKVMTAYIVLRDHPLKMKGNEPEQGPMLTIDAKAEREGHAKDESAIPGLKAGQKFSEYDMLQMLLIPSGNNIARQLGRWDAGSEAAFIKKMNDAAKQLGMKNTTYTDPSGLNKTTVSTAVDQVLLAEQVIKNPVIRSITTKTNTPIKGLDGGINSNIDDLLMKHTGVLGIKTGSSSPAGGTLMWAARKRFGGEEVLVIGATMDQHFKGGPDLNAEMSLRMVKRVSYEQMTAVQNALQQATVVKKGQVVGYIDDQLGGKTPVVATKNVKGFGWGGMKATFSLRPKGKSLPHSAKAGTVVGELLVGSGPDAVKVPVALQKTLSEPSFGSKLTRLG